MRTILVLSLVIGLGAATGCGDRDRRDGGGRLEVVAAFYPLAEAARQVGGNHVDVRDLTPPGVEPHDLELTTSDVDALEDADVLVVMGGGFQPAVEDVADRRGDATLEVLGALEATRGARGAELDPHVWLDPTQMAAIVDLVADRLVATDGAHADDYRAGARAYVDQLRALDRELEDALTECARDEIVTVHAAFGWLAKRYGFREESVSGLVPDEEPDARHLDELIDLVRRDGVTTIFTERLASSELAETLARETGARTAILDPLEGVSSNDDYLSIMRSNASTLADALGCAGAG